MFRDEPRVRSSGRWLRAVVAVAVCLPGVLLADAAGLRPPSGSPVDRQAQLPASDPYLAYLPPAAPAAAAFGSTEPPAKPLAEVVVLGERAWQFRQWMSQWLERSLKTGTHTAAMVGEALLPQEKPGLQFNVNPDQEEIYVGWRVRF